MKKACRRCYALRNGAGYICTIDGLLTLVTNSISSESNMADLFLTKENQISISFFNHNGCGDSDS